MVKIQERDKKLLEYIAMYGVVSSKIIQKIYGDSSRYYRYRKKALADEKYILKNNKYVWLGTKGREYLISKGIEDIKTVTAGKTVKDRLSKISEALIPLQDIYKCYPSWTLKDGKNVLGDRKLKFYGKIVNKLSNNEYYVYNAGSLKELKDIKKAEGLKKAYIKLIREEIVQNAQLGRMDRVIILIEDNRTMQLYKNSLEGLGVKEQLLIPFTEAGMLLLRQLGLRDIKKEAIEYVYRTNYTAPNWKYADCTVEGNKQVVVLINNDGERIVSIKQSILINQYNFSQNSKIVIICLEGQANSFRRQFESIEIKIVPNCILKNHGSH